MELCRARAPHFLCLNMSAPPAHAGGPVGAKDINDASQAVGGSPSSDSESSWTCHKALQPLSHHLDAWRALPGVSEWALTAF